MSGRAKYYLTTAISYINGPPHLGHAYEAIASDVLARFKRLDGFDVMFLTGTDEHGQKVARQAEAEGKEPRVHADEIAQTFRGMVELLNISNDDFIRTTEPRHYASVTALWEVLAAAGEIYPGKYEGWYSVRDEAFFAEKELTKGEGGKLFAPGGAEVEWVDEPTYYFRLSNWGDRLLEHYEAHSDFILPLTRRNEVVNFVKQGLEDLSISRTTFDWGVPVPGAPGHVMYVWLDALTNYITGVGYPDTEDAKYKKYWPADVHMIGKDIVRFHAIYWPAFLMAAGIELPKRVFGHGFLNLEGEKMSKSLGNVLTPEAIVGEYGLDQIRYFLLREVPFGGDGAFSHEAIVRRINADLANDFGNLAQRILSMIAKNCDGVLPEPGALKDGDRTLLAAARDDLAGTTRGHVEQQAFHAALREFMAVIGSANAYVDEQAPWALAKTDRERMGSVLWVVAEVVRCLAVLAQPFVPDAAAKLLDQLAVPEDARTFKHLVESHALNPGTPLPKPQGVFPRYVEAKTGEGGT